MLSSSLVFTGCAQMRLRKAVDLRVKPTSTAPAKALVYIDEQYVGSLKDVAKRGVRLPEGWHRIVVKKQGYYPYETRILSDRKAILLEVKMLRLPE
jgi:hypothetical protein